MRPLDVRMPVPAPHALIVSARARPRSRFAAKRAGGQAMIAATLHELVLKTR
ncbi:hypothetical protein F4553_005215 [Allocatelliglobosispora scoriae]|uniref:Uncharacterized protein n=1 Tax=Allocatelliglobosispora scoriae TaxID=643052 RepID=A0A841BWF7_9ACTN|nr:hypothetical protein [Allocatelliglobosispora scoriae]